jgi:glycosyltransferase involved in cell wall biosynthesis
MQGNLSFKVSVIVPTMNEEDSIGKVLSSIPNDLVDEILVIDSSSDRTPEIAGRSRARVLYEPRKGYGRALQTGIENARGEIVVYIDGDSSYDPTDITKVIELIADAKHDVVLGNRFKQQSNHANMPFGNRVGNRILSYFFRILFNTNVSDSQCGLRGFRRLPLLNYEYRNYGMAYVTEQLTKLVKSGQRVGEVPISYRQRVGKSKLHRFRDGCQIVWTMLRESLESL